MQDRPTYQLSESTVVEPLMDQWVAWTHVLSPVASCLHLLKYQLNTLASYLKNPEIHVTACRNPKLLGGPFINIPVQRKQEVESLYGRIQTHRADELQLAKDLLEFQRYLVREAKGQSIESYYGKIPPGLQGRVELAYDYFNHPMVRCIESLFYESPYYKPHLQSLRILKQARDNSRSFYMSTPRLPQSDQIDWAMPFARAEVDELFRTDLVPQPLTYIKELLGLRSDQESTLLPLLSPATTGTMPAWDGAGVRIRYLGHACVLIEWKGVSILTDPFVPTCSEAGGIDRYTYRDLPAKIDYVLVTHGHHDHSVLESLLRLRHRIGTLVVPRSSGMLYGDPSLKLLAHRLGFRHVVEMDALDTVPLPGGELIGIPFLGEHADLPHAKSGYLIRRGADQMLFAADSNCLDPSMYAHLRTILGPIKTVFLGMECVGAPLTWVYGPFLPISIEHAHNQSRRSNGCHAEAAWNLLEAVGAERVYIYALGREPWLEHVLALAPTDTDPQMRESTKLIERARQRKFVDAQRPFGKFELHLGTDE